MDFVPDDTWMDTKQVANALGISTRQVCELCKTGQLEGAAKHKRRWWIPRAAIDRLGLRTQEPERDLAETIRLLAAEIEGNLTPQAQTPEPESGSFIEISIGLTGAAAAIMTLAPSALGEVDLIGRKVVYGVSLLVGLISLYTSLWFLGKYVEDTNLSEVRRWRDSPIGSGHILSLMTNPATGPYWLLAVSLTFLFLVLIAVGYIAV
jgi:hypothetical protein